MANSFHYALFGWGAAEYSDYNTLVVEKEASGATNIRSDWQGHSLRYEGAAGFATGTDGEWHSVVAQWGGPGQKRRIVLDGEVIAEDSPPTNNHAAVGSSNFCLGGSGLPVLPGSVASFVGSVRNFRVYQHAEHPFPAVPIETPTSYACDYDRVSARDTASRTSFDSCAAVGAGVQPNDCCAVHRSAPAEAAQSSQMSKVYYTAHQETGEGAVETVGHVLGSDVFGVHEHAAEAADLNLDGRADVLVGNKFYLNSAGATRGTRFSAAGTPFSAAEVVRSHVVDFDGRDSYPDIVSIDRQGAAWMHRSSIDVKQVQFQALLNTRTVPIQTHTSTTFTELHVYLDANTNRRNTANLQHTLRFRKGDVLTIGGVDYDPSADGGCDLSGRQAVVESWISLDSQGHSYAGTVYGHDTAHRHVVELRLQLLEPCRSPSTLPASADGAIYLRGRPKNDALRARPAPGQVPTFHAPQRIGGPEDVGVIDVAVLALGEENYLTEQTMDICLLFRGKPVKCFFIGVPDAPILDRQAARRIKEPNPDDTMDDALKFAPIRPVPPSGTRNRWSADYWVVRGETQHLGEPTEMRSPGSYLEVGTVGGVPHGLVEGTTVRLGGAFGKMDQSILNATTDLKFQITAVTESSFRILLPQYATHSPADAFRPRSPETHHDALPITPTKLWGQDRSDCGARAPAYAGRWHLFETDKFVPAESHSRFNTDQGGTNGVCEDNTHDTNRYGYGFQNSCIGPRRGTVTTSTGWCQAHWRDYIQYNNKRNPPAECAIDTSCSDGSEGSILFGSGTCPIGYDSHDDFGSTTTATNRECRDRILTMRMDGGDFFPGVVDNEGDTWLEDSIINGPACEFYATNSHNLFAACAGDVFIEVLETPTHVYGAPIGMQADCPDEAAACNQLVVLREHEQPSVMTPNAYASAFARVGTVDSHRGRTVAGQVAITASRTPSDGNADDARRTLFMNAVVDAGTGNAQIELWHGTNAQTLTSIGADLGSIADVAFCRLHNHEGSVEYAVVAVGNNRRPRVWRSGLLPSDSNFYDLDSDASLDPRANSVQVLCADFDGDGIEVQTQPLERSFTCTLTLLLSAQSTTTRRTYLCTTWQSETRARAPSAATRWAGLATRATGSARTLPRASPSARRAARWATASPTSSSSTRRRCCAWTSRPSARSCSTTSTSSSCTRRRRGRCSRRARRARAPTAPTARTSSTTGRAPRSRRRTTARRSRPPAATATATARTTGSASASTACSAACAGAPPTAARR